MDGWDSEGGSLTPSRSSSSSRRALSVISWMLMALAAECTAIVHMAVEVEVAVVLLGRGREREREREVEREVRLQGSKAPRLQGRSRVEVSRTVPHAPCWFLGGTRAVEGHGSRSSSG
jgi:hypothetical protein